MKYLVCGLMVAACSATQKPAVAGADAVTGARVAADASRAASELSCAHCHASREEAQKGLLSPGPPWPGTAQRTVLKGVAGMTLSDAADRCAHTYQGRGLSPQQRADVVAYVESQGEPLPGQPRVYDGKPAGADAAKQAMQLDGDSLRGETLFARACARCHRDGPGYAVSALASSSRVEVVLKVLQVPANARKQMPNYPAGSLSLQELADIASYVAPQN